MAFLRSGVDVLGRGWFGYLLGVDRNLSRNEVRNQLERVVIVGLNVVENLFRGKKRNDFFFFLWVNY